MTTLYVIFLGVVPLCALIALFMYYTRRNVKYWWKKSNTASPNVTANGRCHPYVFSHCFDSVQRWFQELCSCFCRLSSGSCRMHVGDFWQRMCMCFKLQDNKIHCKNVQKRPLEMNNSGIDTNDSLSKQSKLEITKPGFISTTNSNVFHIMNVDGKEISSSVHSETIHTKKTLNTEKQMLGFNKLTVSVDCHSPKSGFVLNNTKLTKY